jgi:hypothetical protein
VTTVLAAKAPAVPDEYVNKLLTSNPEVLATVIVVPELEAPDQLLGTPPRG